MKWKEFSFTNAAFFIYSTKKYSKGNICVFSVQPILYNTVQKCVPKLIKIRLCTNITSLNKIIYKHTNNLNWYTHDISDKCLLHIRPNHDLLHYTQFILLIFFLSFFILALFYIYTEGIINRNNQIV